MTFYKKQYGKIGLIIALLNIFSILNAIYYFLFMADFTITGWLFFNACTPSILIFLIGYFMDKKYLMAASLPFLFFFGVGGLFVFGWIGTSIFAQIGHILMVIAASYTIFIIVIEKKFKKSLIGFCSGLILFLMILPLQQNYVKDHPEYLKKLGDPKFEKFVNEK